MKYLHLHFDFEYNGAGKTLSIEIRRFEVVNHFGPEIAIYDRIAKDEMEKELGFLVSRILYHAEAVFINYNVVAPCGIAVYTFLENFDNLHEIDLNEILFEQP